MRSSCPKTSLAPNGSFVTLTDAYSTRCPNIYKGFLAGADRPWLFCASCALAFFSVLISPSISCERSSFGSQVSIANNNRKQANIAAAFPGPIFLRPLTTCNASSFPNVTIMIFIRSSSSGKWGCQLSKLG